MTGRVMTKVRVTHPRTARFNASTREVEARVRGGRVEEVGRKGKFLVIDLDNGEAVVAHLGMSGRFSVSSPDSPPDAHTHFTALLDDGREVRFVDPRTFGFISVVDKDDLVETGVGRLGPDAWTDPPAPAELAAALGGRSAPIKALLLDQGPISGLGNIYADEALHLARIHPLTPGGELDHDQVRRLLAATHDVLEKAIESGGTTLDDLAYLLPDGRAGEYLSRLHVYGRTAEPCHQCGSAIARVIVRARSTHYCPGCQRR